LFSISGNNKNHQKLAKDWSYRSTRMSHNILTSTCDSVNLALPLNNTIVQLAQKLIETVAEIEQVETGAETWNMAGGTPLSLLVADAMARINTDVDMIIDLGDTVEVGGTGLVLGDNPVVMNIEEIRHRHVTAFEIVSLQNGYSYSVTT
jgi:hypothetical protein